MWLLICAASLLPASCTRESAISSTYSGAVCGGLFGQVQLAAAPELMRPRSIRRRAPYLKIDCPRIRAKGHLVQ